MPKQPPRDQKLLNTLGANIAKSIKKAGFKTAEEFAWENKISKTTLSRIIHGQVEARIIKLSQIAKALKVTVDDLLKPPSKD